MKDKEPAVTEAEVAAKLAMLLLKMGFKVDSNHNSRVRTPDLIAEKKVDGLDYKIAIELKNSTDVNQAVRAGIDTLNNASKIKRYDKLLLLLMNNRSSGRKSVQLQNYLHNNPTNLEIINLEELEKWSESLPDEQTAKEFNEVIYYIKILSKKLIELVARNPDNLKQLEWRDLERTIAELFEGIGFKTTLTPSSKDGGKDVILECTIDEINKSYIIEIKHWRSGQKVGQNAVKEFTQVIFNEKREKGLFLSTYGFSNNYYESLTEKEKSVIRFGEQNKIVELCRTYEKINSGIWNPIGSLEDVLFANTVDLKG